MDYSRLTIGQMAAINHLTPQTLRFYEQEGLLSPAVINPDTGYRYYHISQNARLNMIQYLKSLGVSLRQIKEHLDSGDNEWIIELLRQKNSQIDEQVLKLKQQKKAINRAIESIKRYECSPPDGTIVLEFIPKRDIFRYDTGINFYEGGISLYEQMLHGLKEKFRRHRLPEIYLSNVGTIMPRQAILQNRFYSSVVFVIVDPEFIDEKLLSSLPASTYLCIYCDDFDKEIGYAAKLFDEVEQKGYILGGDYICEIIHEPPSPGDSGRKMFLRLQVPIKFK